ncbi:uncharacterized protein LOC134677197 isoform X2 [Cydia fagiglandana]|uniref:uncharacterized protein LOC134677197 isoform X2 n=1 Tax=Cydia fagiglandana TaxID=1458189 RepID=UPI002FEE0D3D
MKACCVKHCRSESFRGCGISFYRIPRKEPIRQKWLDAIGYVPKRKNPVVCSSHFRPEELAFSGMRPLVIPDAVPSIFPTEPTAPLIAQYSPGPSQSATDTLDSDASTEEPQELLKQASDSDASTEEPQEHLRQVSDSDASTEEPQETLRQVFSVSNASTKPQDPLRQDTKQCRFCGKYSKDCIPISPTHLASFTTKLAFNDNVVQFSEALPKTVCKDCEAKLQIVYDFVKYAKAAQELLINVEEDGEEMVEVKNEYEDDDETYDRLEEDNNSDEERQDKKVDLFTMGQTVYIKENQKRKIVTISGVKPKKAKVIKSESGNEETKKVNNRKEKVIDRDDTNVETDNIGLFNSDTRTNKPGVAGFTKRVFVHKVRIDGNS